MPVDANLTPTALQVVALCLFCLALVHVFLAAKIESLAHRFHAHSGTLHLLGEVEVVFGFWALVLFGFHSFLVGYPQAVAHLESLNFHEPIFVFVIMVVAGCRPVIQAASQLVQILSRMIPLPGAIGFAFVTLGVAPLLGSFITEPAAMTVAALLLRDRILPKGISDRMRYAALGTLFVNISIGGTLTTFAAPPVLMVAGAWGWDGAYMLSHFGVRAIPVVLLNAAAFAFLFRKELAGLPKDPPRRTDAVPAALIALHLVLLALVVVVSHHTVLLVGLLLFFLGIVQAYRRHHSPLLLREALLVGFFLGGLVVLGSQQAWWLSPLVEGLSDKVLLVGATGLTAVVDNAALTYLGSLIPSTTESFRYHLVAGAVAGGGLTLIANAPNPAGASILRERFPEGIIAPARLFLWALPPTLVALLAFGI
ncbi:MAG: putative Na+/H+ antiporter [Fibrobacteres bacterium]|nr:putative Na+/H+ antiporter [Fibrobacterota bacterium]